MLASRVAVLVLLLSSAGCTGFIQNTGNAILSTIGLEPSKVEQQSDSVLDKTLSDMTPEQEYYLGRAVAAKILTLYQPVSDESLQRYVSTVGLSVALASPTPETFGGYHFLLLESEQVNAMAAPGGFIFITRGFLQLLSDEDALAAVLAHEVSHVALHHGVEAVRNSKLRDALQRAAQLAGAMSCAEVLQSAVVLYQAVADDIVDVLLTRGYSREQEFEADQAAIPILGQVGYQSAGLDRALRLLDAAQGDGGWFSTHPKPADRMVRIHVEQSLDNETVRIRRKRFEESTRH